MYYYGTWNDNKIAPAIMKDFLYFCFILVAAMVSAYLVCSTVYAVHVYYMEQPGLSMEQKNHSEKLKWGMEGTDSYRNGMPK